MLNSLIVFIASLSFALCLHFVIWKANALNVNNKQRIIIGLSFLIALYSTLQSLGAAHLGDRLVSALVTSIVPMFWIYITTLARFSQQLKINSIRAITLVLLVLIAVAMYTHV